MNLLLAASLIVHQPEDSKQKALYSRLQPRSIAEHAAFYDLYDETALGQEALKISHSLLGIKDQTILTTPQDVLPFFTLKQRTKTATLNFSENALTIIEKAAGRLANRRLKGFSLSKPTDVLSLEESDIDISAALLLTQLQDPKEQRKMKALLDLMALQVLAWLPENATHDQKIDAINKLLFVDMGYRFPPKSTFQQNIDFFTLLPSVIEERKGVCLGVTLMYLCIAQRIDLPFEIITPPGHIYIRCGARNIETTMHGVHLPDAAYLGLTTKRLHIRSRKEAIGLSYINQASLALSAHRYEEAEKLYEQAAIYIQDDRLLEELRGVALFLLGQDKQARKHLQKAILLGSDEIQGSCLANDILDREISKEAVEPLFDLLTEKRASLEARKNALQKVVNTYPKFRSALFQLAICYLDLNQPKEALPILEQRSALLKEDLATEYLLATLYAKRNQIPKAKYHLSRAKKIAKESFDTLPNSFIQLESSLFYISP